MKTQTQIADKQTPMTADVLDGFIGSSEFFKHGLARRYIYTGGVRFLAERAGAYWLIDLVALHGSRKINGEDFQVWTLRKGKSANGTALKSENAASLATDDGNGKILDVRYIEYTDFPLPEMKLYVCRNEMDGWTVMLPSEY